MSIATATTMMGTSAFAAFTTTATAKGNTFSTGTASLLISTDVNGPFTASITNPFTATGITPGFSQGYTFYLRNDGTDPLSVTSSFANGVSDATLEGVLLTDFECNNAANPGAFSVTDMRAGSVNLGTIGPNEVVTCTVTASLPSSADNSVANKTTSFNALFNGTSVPSI